MPEFFVGRWSLRSRGERTALVITVLVAPAALGIIGAFLHETLGLSTIAVVIVASMIYVTLARGQLL
ncbi:MAG: hypothetical protein JO018_01475, partial [Candidatus Eremiobacteraeota bacterium]|nr:hypothetical protein [Candidatus Eremiobacteraeota bacterium]